AERRVRHWSSLYREPLVRYTVGRALVVVGEAAGGRPHLERPGGDLDPVVVAVGAWQAIRRTARQPAEEQRLAHRLRVLQLVPDHELVQIASPHVLQYAQRPLADLRHVRERLLAVEELDLAAHGAWRLECVVGRRKVLAHKR